MEERSAGELLLDCWPTDSLVGLLATGTHIDTVIVYSKTRCCDDSCEHVLYVIMILCKHIIHF